MRIYPAIHYTMGGLWVDYNLMSTIPGLYVIGEANFSDHGANRLGASALMQGLADGYFILPYTIGDYLATTKLPKVDASHAAFRESEAQVACKTKRLLEIKGTRSVDSFHRDLGKLVWEYCGMARTAEGLQTRARKDPRAARAILARRQRAGHGRRVESVARKSRPRRRFPGARRADVPGRSRAQRILRRPLPRGVPDARGRGLAQRRGILLRGGLAVSRRGQAARPASKSRCTSTTYTRVNGATSK